jgi:lipid-A-disaccharide synthase
MGDLFVDTARALHARFPAARFLVPLVSRETRLQFEEAVWRRQAQDLPIKLLFGHAQDALAASDVALVASGTATLEAALLRTPMVIAYRMSPWSWRLMKRMRYQPWVGQPNFLSGRFVVPEFIQEDATPENLAQALGNLAQDNVIRARIGRAFADIHEALRQDTAERAAVAVLPFLGAAA